MKKIILINLLMVASCFYSALLNAAQAVQSDHSNESKKVLADLPKKIRISTKPAAPVKHITTSTSDILEKKIDPPAAKSDITPISALPKVEDELEQTLLAMQARATQRPSMKSSLDDAIAHLANTNQDHGFDQQEVKDIKVKPWRNRKHSNDVKTLDDSQEFEALVQSNMTDDQEENITTNVDVSTVAKSQTVVVSNDGITRYDPDHEYIDDNQMSGPRVIKNDLIDQTKLDKKRIYLGRAYNYAVIEEEEEKHYVVPSAIFLSYAFQGFDNCKRQVPLASVLLNGKSFTVGDIFLEARLSHEPITWPADTENDASVLFLEPNGPGNVTTANGQTAQFGNRRLQQYLGLLAPVEIDFSTNYYQVVAQSGFIYRFYLTEEELIAFSAGIIFPIVSRFQETTVNLQNGNLYDRTEFSAKDTTYRESSIGRFFNDFSSLGDFFQRAVLEPKGLVLAQRQQQIGVGDISLFGLFDFAPMVCHMDGLQLGVNLSLPTSNKATGNTIFEIELDEGGATTFDIFANCIFNSGNRYINPSLYLSGNFAVPFTANMRVPRLVSHVAVTDTSGSGEGLAVDGNRVTNIPGLIAPVMREFFALSFSDYDSLIPGFSDSVSVVRLSRGPKAIFGLGNYFYDVFGCNFRFGIFYDFTAKGSDNVCPTNCNATPNMYDTSGYKCISSYAHRIGLNLTYKFGCGELNVGAQFVVSGKNTPKINEAFASYIAVF